MMERLAQSWRNDGTRELASNGKTMDETRALRRSKQLFPKIRSFSRKLQRTTGVNGLCTVDGYTTGRSSWLFPAQTTLLVFQNRSRKLLATYYVPAYPIASLVLNKFSSRYRCLLQENQRENTSVRDVQHRTPQCSSNKLLHTRSYLTRINFHARQNNVEELIKPMQQGSTVTTIIKSNAVSRA